MDLQVSSSQFDFTRPICYVWGLFLFESGNSQVLFQTIFWSPLGSFFSLWSTSYLFYFYLGFLDSTSSRWFGLGFKWLGFLPATEIFQSPFTARRGCAASTLPREPYGQSVRNIGSNDFFNQTKAQASIDHHQILLTTTRGRQLVCRLWRVIKTSQYWRC